MRASKPTDAERSRSRSRALSRWEGEGGAACGAPLSPEMDRPAPEREPKLIDAELVQLRIRVIALENLVIALLAEAPLSQLERVREMATFISPRPGFTSHRATLAAAVEMLSLVDRAAPFRSIPAADL